MLHDCHIHCLPGVDDGPKGVEQAIELIAATRKVGISRLWATYHFREGLWEPSLADANRARSCILERMPEEPDFRLGLICEFHLSDRILQMLKAGQIAVSPSRSFLLELPHLSAPSIHNIIFGICSIGYTPVICHPERLVSGPPDITALETARTLGALIQIDAFSATGLGGKSAMKSAQALLSKGLVDYIASDAHLASDGRTQAFIQMARMYPHLCKGDGLE